MVTPLAIKVPPDKYGGSEFVIYYLTEELVRRGHQVDLYSTADSETSGNLIPIIEKGSWSKTGKTSSLPDQLRMMYKIAKNSAKYDLIHDHLGPLGTLLAKLTNKPVISTLHVPTNPEKTVLYQSVENFHLISISNNQRVGFEALNYAATVYNGIPVDDYDFNDKSEDYLFFLGRFDAVKGAKEAIDLAKRTNHRLLLAARIEDEKYYEEFVKPEIDGEQIVYVGEVGFDEKLKLLKGAKALVSLINWEEPFGLVVPEANACGTPVIVNPRGAFPELVKDGVNGFLTDNSIEGAEEALKKIETISRKDCRKFVEDNFSVKRMVDDYLKVYEKLVN